jgi:prevent-host-death family protein
MDLDEVKARFDYVFDLVMAGDEVIVTRHGQPIARIIPEKKGNQTEAS